MFANILIKVSILMNWIAQYILDNRIKLDKTPEDLSFVMFGSCNDDSKSQKLFESILGKKPQVRI